MDLLSAGFKAPPSPLLLLQEKKKGQEDLLCQALIYRCLPATSQEHT